MSQSYAASGVNIAAAEDLLAKAQPQIRNTHTSGVISLAKGFSGLFSAEFPHLEHPVLAATTDGVGTKTKIATMAGEHFGIGQDIVNHCINDLLCVGAHPLFFQDYFACAEFDEVIFSQVMSGMTAACQEAGIALLGGETAQMPGIYHGTDYDLAGTMVGVVNREKILTGETIAPGDILIGLRSNGLHTNGYSLARRVLFESSRFRIGDAPDELRGKTIGEALLLPHTSYLSFLQKPLESSSIKGLAHITGGGIPDNIVRILPEGCKAEIDCSVREPPPIFGLIQRAGDIPRDDMFRTFNMGIGMIAVISRDFLSEVSQGLLAAIQMGKIVTGQKSVTLRHPE